MAKKAVLIGINYPGTAGELNGCVNDAKRVHRFLVDRFGFCQEDIKVLIDTDEAYTQPTAENIRQALSSLVQSAEPGDFLFVHYSGHGVIIPPADDEDDDTGHDECIVPCDMEEQLITDDCFRELVRRVPEGCRITIVSDSCHSGGLIDGAKEQIGESTKLKKKETETRTSRFEITTFFRRIVRDAIKPLGIQPSFGLLRRGRSNIKKDLATEPRYGAEGVSAKSRSLPLATLAEIIKQRTGNDDVDIGKFRPTLSGIFGEIENPKNLALQQGQSVAVDAQRDQTQPKKFRKVGKTKLQRGDGESKGGGFLWMMGYLAVKFVKEKLDNRKEPALEKMDVSSKQEVYAGTNKRLLPENGILISGCQSDESSEDVTNSRGESFGAFSNAIYTILAETGGAITNHELVWRAGKTLKKQGFPQRPGLYCSDHHARSPFIC